MYGTKCALFTKHVTARQRDRAAETRKQIKGNNYALNNKLFSFEAKSNYNVEKWKGYVNLCIYRQGFR